MPMTETFVIVGCGSAKRDERSAAKDLYTSTYFGKKREFAEAVGDQWMILSAKHGLISPESEFAPYDTTIDDLHEDELDELAFSVGMTLIDWIEWERGSDSDVRKVIVLAGRKYLDPLRERETFAAGVEPLVRFPFQELDLGGIGEQMAWLDERIRRAGLDQSILSHFGGGTRV